MACLQRNYNLFLSRAFVVRSLEEQCGRSAGSSELKRVLGWFDLIMLGVGGIVGAGVFVLTGVAAQSLAGPGVIVSYMIAGFAATIAALCYAEYAADIPLAGGAFNYISLTFGEFIAWVVACDLILEYTLSAAAVAKGLSGYLAALFGFPLSSVRYSHGILQLDPIALVSILIMSAILCRGIAESSAFNIAVSLINMGIIAFILTAGFPHADSANYTPFLPFGWRGIFSGASVVFFSFIGFDTVATAAEEVHNPAVNLPIGIVGSLSIASALYVAMAACITGMQRYSDIDVNAPFATAFEHVGMGWARRVVSAGALTGIVTSLLVSLLGQARIYVTLGRTGLLPRRLAHINETTRTPIAASCVTACTAGVLAFLLDINLLAELVSIGTLVVFFLVCAGVIFRRYVLVGSDSRQELAPVAWRLVAIGAVSIAFSISFTEGAPLEVPGVLLLAWLALTCSFVLLPVKYRSPTFRCPLSPFLPSLGMLATLHLIGSLGWPAYVRWVVWFAVGNIVYLCYGMHQVEKQLQPRGALFGGSRAQEGLQLHVLSDSSRGPEIGPLEAHATLGLRALDEFKIISGDANGQSTATTRVLAPPKEAARPRSSHDDARTCNDRQQLLSDGSGGSMELSNTYNVGDTESRT